MPSSKTDILNRARDKIGAPAIADIEDPQQPAAVIGLRVFNDCFEQELAAHTWCFATRRAALPPLSDPPAWGYAFAYELPVDYLSIVSIEGVDYADLTNYRGDTEPGFRIEGRQILTDAEAPLLIRYVIRETNTGRYPPAFREALQCRMALEMAEPVAQKGNDRAQRLMLAYKDAIRRALRVNAIEVPSEATPDDAWVMGRL